MLFNVIESWVITDKGSFFLQKCEFIFGKNITVKKQIKKIDANNLKTVVISKANFIVWISVIDQQRQVMLIKSNEWISLHDMNLRFFFRKWIKMYLLGLHDIGCDGGVRELFFAVKEGVTI